MGCAATYNHALPFQAVSTVFIAEEVPANRQAAVWVLRLGPARTVASPGILLNPEREVMVAAKAPWPFLLPGPVSPCLLFDRGRLSVT